jgi:hypothetical protein
MRSVPAAGRDLADRVPGAYCGCHVGWREGDLLIWPYDARPDGVLLHGGPAAPAARQKRATHDFYDNAGQASSAWISPAGSRLSKTRFACLPRFLRAAIAVPIRA